MPRSLPHLKILNFGNSLEWLHLRNLLTSLILNENYPSVIKFSYPSSFLKGEALESIKSISIFDEN